MIVFTVSEPHLFGAAFCIAIAALLAMLVLACDRDGNLRTR